MARTLWDEVTPETISPSRLNANDNWAAYESTIARTSVRLATTAALAANTRAGNVLTMNANGALSAIDGVTPALNDVILVKNEAAPENNGRHYVSQLGDASHPAKLTRCADADVDAETPVGVLMYVWDGTAAPTGNKGKFFFLDLNAGGVTVNSTGQVYTQLPRDADVVHLAGAETLTGSKTLADGADIPLGTATGSKIGTATGQKLAFHNATPVVQRAGAAQAAVTATVGSDIAAFTDPPSAAEMATLRTFVNANKADIAAVIVLVNELRAALVAKGLIKGSA